MRISFYLSWAVRCYSGNRGRWLPFAPDTLPKVWQLSLVFEKAEDEKEFPCFIFRCSSKREKGAQRFPNPFVNGFCLCPGAGIRVSKSSQVVRFFFFCLFLYYHLARLLSIQKKRTVGQSEDFAVYAKKVLLINCTPGGSISIVSLHFSSLLCVWCAFW